MKYNLAFKYRIYPNKEQELLINKTFGCVRFVYNTILYIANKIYDLKSGKIQIINVNRYIQRILLLILFYISLFNLSLNLKVYNHFIHVLVVIFIILSSLSVLITFIIKKKIFDAYYFNFNFKKLIPFLIFFVGIGYFLNSYKNTLEALNNKSMEKCTEK